MEGVGREGLGFGDASTRFEAKASAECPIILDLSNGILSGSHINCVTSGVQH